MSTLLRVFAIGVLCTFGAMAAGYAQSVTCQNAEYDPALLEKYPNLPKSCFDIVTRDGENYAVVKAKLDRVTSNDSVVVRIKHPDGSYAKPTTLRTPSGMRVLVQGEPTRVSDLSTGQELTAYVKVREPVIALAPAEESTPLTPTPLDEPVPQEQMAATLPATASVVPLLGLLGSAFLLLGGVLTVIRQRRR